MRVFEAALKAAALWTLALTVGCIGVMLVAQSLPNIYRLWTRPAPLLIGTLCIFAAFTCAITGAQQL